MFREVLGPQHFGNLNAGKPKTQRSFKPNGIGFAKSLGAGSSVHLPQLSQLIRRPNEALKFGTKVL